MLKNLFSKPKETVEELNKSGMAYYEKQQFEKALEYFQKALELATDHPWMAYTYNNIGNCYRNLGDRNQAAESFGKAASLNPNEPVYRQNYEQFGNKVKQAVIPEPIEDEEDEEEETDNNDLSDEAQEFVDEGDAFFEEEDYKKALDAYKKALKLHPESASVLHLIGISYSWLDKSDQAMTYYKKALDCSDDNDLSSEILENLLGIYSENENNEEIIALIPRVKKIKTENAAIYNYIGLAFFNDDDYSQAIFYFEKATQFDSKEKLYKKNLKLAQESLLEAAENAENPDEGEELKTQAADFLNEEEYEKSIEYYLKALEFNPNDPDILCSIGIAYSWLDDNDNTLKYYKMALEADPGHTVPSILPNVVRFYFNIEDYDQALDYLKMIKTIDWEDDDFLNVAGNIYFVNDQFKDAIPFYEKAIANNPDNEDYHENLKLAKEELKNATENTSTASSDTPSAKKTEVPLNASLESVLAELDKMVGMTNIKDDIQTLIKFLRVEKRKQEVGISGTPLTLHTVFYGPPGTGKTTIARMMGSIFKAMGILSKGHVVEVDRSSMVGDAWGTTGPKTSKLIEEALDGILFIDEAYTLKQSDEDVFGQDAIDTLLKRMEDYRSRIVVIAAGYEPEMKSFVDSNTGLKSRFTRYFTFKDFTASEMLQLFKHEAREYIIRPEAEEKLLRFFEFLYKTRDKSFGNGREVRNFFLKVSQIQSTRMDDVDTSNLSPTETKDILRTITLPDIENSVKGVFVESGETSQDEIMRELNELVGIDNIRGDIDSLSKFIRIEKMRKEKGMATTQVSYHMVYYGPPGTGKTTIARLMGKIFRSLGVLSKGHVVEVDRAALVGDVWGATSMKTDKVVESALDGILFIDEAYTLKQSADDVFGQDAIDTLLKRMEDYRSRLIVIVGGYTEEMQKFIESNAGLKSRFTRYFYFKDYNGDDLLEIVRRSIKSKKFKMEPECEELLKDFFDLAYANKDRTFGNARFARTTLDKIMQAQSDRVGNMDIESITDDDLISITKPDVEKVIVELSKDFAPKNPTIERRKIGFN
jgi:tetratricopeptide (TPR) repeat protein/replication-associated recombination protein RarA